MIAASNGQSTYTAIYVALAIITVLLIPAIGFLLKSVIGQLKENTHETNELARTVERVIAVQESQARDVSRHERELSDLRVAVGRPGGRYRGREAE